MSRGLPDPGTTWDFVAIHPGLELLPIAPGHLDDLVLADLGEAVLTGQ